MYRNTIEDRARLLVNKVMTDKKVQVLMDKMRTFDSTLFIHSINVAFLTAHECYILGYGKRDRYIYVVAALLHDIGKIKIDIQLLNKKEPLGKEEFETLKKHPVYSGEVLQEAGFGKEIIDIAVHHHEKPDGSGYPDGLSDKEIPMGSKMLAAIDAYDAMTSRRPYGSQKNKTQAITTLQYENNYYDKYIESLKNIDL